MKKLLFFLLIMVSVSLYSQNLDIRLLRSINTPHELKADGYNRFVSNSAFVVTVAAPLAVGTVGLIKQDKEYGRNFCFLIASTAATIVVTDIIKYSVNRQRPFKTYGDILNKSRLSDLDPSFPSGHTSSVFNTATYVSLVYRKWYIVVPAFAWAGSVGYSRMYLGVHYPGDVLAGAAIGAGTAYLSYVISKKLR